ncbi:MAG: hypothetical protein R3Y67_01585 [Eubacteriales bacterium]
MVSVLLSWVYIGITAGCVGILVNQGIKKVFHYELQSIEVVIFSGLIAISSMAHVVSFFYPISFGVHIILCSISILTCILFPKEIMGILTKENKKSPYAYAIFFIGCMILCYFTSRGYEHTDTALYHGQAIRWLEEYGTVVGLGNINYRLGYNTSAFMLTAVYSMECFIGQSLHTVGGFLAILLWYVIILEYWNNKNKVLRISDFVRLGAIYYLTITFSYLQSTSTDLATFLVLVYLIVKYVDLVERKERSITPYALLSVATCFAVTIKLSAAPVILLVLYPAICLIKEKKYKGIGLFISMGLLVIIPYLIRGVLLSGWLLYPSTSIDLFSFTFQVHEEVAHADQLAMVLWARNAAYGETIIQWFPNWFLTAGGRLVQLLLIGDFLGLIALIILWIVEIREKGMKLNVLVLDITLVSSLIFWFATCPLVRYGYAYIILFVFYVIGRWSSRWISTRLYRGFQVACVLFCSIKLLTTLQFAALFVEEPYYVWQQDYEIFQGELVEIDGVWYYKPNSEDQIGYHLFPTYLATVEWELRGRSVEDGFQLKQ